MRPKVSIGIPTHDGKLHKECAFGLLSAWGRGVACSVNVVQGSFLPRNRDRIVRDFLLKRDGTHLLCVDADIAWTSAHLEMLLELDADFAFGFYALKMGGARPPLACSRRLSTELRFLPDPILVDRFDRCGAGFVLLRREALERMVDAYAPTESYAIGDPGAREEFVGLWQTSGRVEQDGAVMAEGEDYAFCRRWRAIGGEIVARRDVCLGHVGAQTWWPAMVGDQVVHEVG